VPRFQNLLQVLKILPKTNCRECREKTCMAFAAAVFKGEKELSLCPYVPAEIIEQYGPRKPQARNIDEDLDNAVNQLKQKIKQTDLTAAAGRTGGRFDGGRLTMKVMGKDFGVDAAGHLYTDIHVNPWVTAPILNYILCCKGIPPTGRWTSMRELPSGKDWHHFFQHQCEKPLKKLADTYTDLFEDLVHLFEGRQVENHYQSDISVVLHPLPLVPLLICYWRTEEGMDSNLNLFFDITAEDNLGIQGLYSLGTGINRMFQKLAHRHGVTGANAN
jgi:hypothetical protein